MISGRAGEEDRRLQVEGIAGFGSAGYYILRWPMHSLGVLLNPS